VKEIYKSLAGSLGLDDFLHDLGLLDEESPEDANDCLNSRNLRVQHKDVPGLDTVSASRSTVGTLNSLLALGDGGVLAGAESRDLYRESESIRTPTKHFGTYTGESNTTITALRSSSSLLQVVVHQLATGGLDDAPLVGGGVVGGALADGDSLGHGGR
jgi:hypothetical protein